MRFSVQAEKIVRSLWAQPSVTGAQVVATVLSNPAHNAEWWVTFHANSLLFAKCGLGSYFKFIRGCSLWKDIIPYAFAYSMCPVVAGTYKLKVFRVFTKHSPLCSCRQEEVKCIMQRCMLIREILRERLRLLGTPGCWDHLTRQRGLYCCTGLNGKQHFHPKFVLRACWMKLPVF